MNFDAIWQVAYTCGVQGHIVTRMVAREERFGEYNWGIGWTASSSTFYQHGFSSIGSSKEWSWISVTADCCCCCYVQFLSIVAFFCLKACPCWWLRWQSLSVCVCVFLVWHSSWLTHADWLIHWCIDSSLSHAAAAAAVAVTSHWCMDQLCTSRTGKTYNFLVVMLICWHQHQRMVNEFCCWNVVIWYKFCVFIYAVSTFCASCALYMLQVEDEIIVHNRVL